jgi:hypothetical protein
MSVIAEDLPPHTQIKVHLHEREDEIILIPLGEGIATLAIARSPLAGATICRTHRSREEKVRRQA